MWSEMQIKQPLGYEGLRGIEMMAFALYCSKRWWIPSFKIKIKWVVPDFAPIVVMMSLANHLILAIGNGVSLVSDFESHVTFAVDFSCYLLSPEY